MTNKKIYILGALFLIIASIFSSGYHQTDEHFQIFEFAGLKLGLTEAQNLPWEYHSEMRPAIQPAMVYTAYNLFDLFGINNPFTIAAFLRMLAALVSFISIYLLYSAYKSEFKDKIDHKWFLLLSFFTWFALYNNVRYSSENLSGTVFIIGFAFYLIKQNPKKLHFLLLGSLLGLSFLFRYQVGFLIAGMFLWILIIKKEKILNLLILSSGIMILIGFGVLLDRWFYNEWTFTIWNYLDQNILMDQSSRFGTSPWWDYFITALIKTIPPFSLVFIGSVFIVFLFKRKDLLTWTVLPFILIHFIIGHKELRFLFPIIGFLPIFIIKGIHIIQEKWYPDILQYRIIRYFIKIFWGVNIILLLIVTFRPADYEVPLYEVVYNNYEQPITLHFIRDYPYHIQNMNFYKRPNLDVRRIMSISEVTFNDSGKCLFVTLKKYDAENSLYNAKLVYSTFPGWIKYFNFNNWMERTRIWHVYELSCE